MKLDKLFLIYLLTISVECKVSKQLKEKKEAKCPLEIKEYEYAEKASCYPYFDLDDEQNNDIEDPEMTLRNRLPSSNSAWINCAACIAITEKVETLLEKMTEPEADKCKGNNEKNVMVKPDLEDMCHGFQRYVYQENKGEQSIGPLKSGSSLVQTADVDSWPEKLQYMCYMLVTAYGETNILDEWAENKDIEIPLCGGKGVFGACNFLNNTMLTNDDFDNDDDVDDANEYENHNTDSC